MRKQSQSLKQFIYIDSSEEEPQNWSPQARQKVVRECNSHFSQGLNHQQKLKRIVQQQIQKIENGDQLMVEVNDRQIEEAVLRRKEKYRYFIKQMEVDAKYRNIMGGRVQKLQAQNSRKEQILQNKRNQQKLKEEEYQLRKYAIKKEDQQQKVLKGVQKFVHKLGVQRNSQLAHKIKTEVKQTRNQTYDQLANLRTKQRNELQELRQRYEELKAVEKMNRLQQEKALRQMQIKNKVLKKEIEGKLLIRKDFII